MPTRSYPELLDKSLTQVASLIKRGEVSPVEVMQATLARIEAVNPKLAAYITVFDDQAMKVARAAETMMSVGHDLGPLHGIPIALKDKIATKGKLNMHEFAWGGTSDNPHYGAVRNPWNTDRFPAGSSGGSGAAVAARACFGAIGTDTGGSIRLPSAINGIVGIRPTYGRVSNSGIVPLAWSMDTAGPMARTVEDCALMFSVIAGHDPADPTTAKVATSDYLARLNDGVKGLRI